MKNHHYQVMVTWTGNQGLGTQDYKSYSRSHSISSEGKYEEILASSDPAFRGDKTRYNPEDLFLSSITACHMLWFLHLCSVHNITVTEYLDQAEGFMEESMDGSGRFTKVILNPKVKVTDSQMINKANELHEEANKMCFIANSCNFRIEHQPTTKI